MNIRLISYPATEELRDLMNSKICAADEVEYAMGLVRLNANPNIKNDRGYSLLHFLTFNNPNGKHDDYIQELVNTYGADINIKDEIGKTPLLMTIKYAMKHGADTSSIRKIIGLNALDANSKSLLHLLAGDKSDMTAHDFKVAYYINYSYLCKTESLFFKNKKRLRIGGGTFSNVFLGHCHDKQVAVKELDRKLINFIDFRYEVNFMQALNAIDSDYVIKYVGFDIGLTTYSIVMEYACYGSLSEYIKKTPYHSVSWTSRGDFASSLLVGLGDIHRCGIIHCDLKSANILVCEGKKIKIADFGSSLTFFEKVSRMLTTEDYCPPEIDEENTCYSEKTDIFSLAVILWEIAAGILIFDHLQDAYAYYKSGKRPLIPQDTPKMYAETIEQCWQADPKKRPTMQECVERLTASNDYESHKMSK